MDKKAADGFVNASLSIDETRGIKDEEEQGEDAEGISYQ